LAWPHLQRMCFAALGHEVYFFEDWGDYSDCCNPATGAVDTDPACGLEFAGAVFDSTGLDDKWACEPTLRRKSEARGTRQMSSVFLLAERWYDLAA